MHVPRCLWGSAAVVVVLGACNTSLTVPADAQITCATTADCPSSYRCVAAVCVSLAAPQPPRVVVAAPARSVDVVEIPVTVSDFDAATVALTAEIDVGSGFIAATIDPVSVPATAEGVPATIRWHAATQLGSQAYRARVVARVTPVGGAPATSPAFAFGNDPPVITAPAISGTKSFDVGVAFTLADTASDLASVGLSFGASPTGPWSAASISLGSTTSLATSGGGVDHAVIWASSAAPATDPTKPQGIGYPARWGTVYLRLEPRDVVLGTTFTGTPLVLGPFVVDDTFNAPPTAVVLAPDGLQSGVVLVTYTLADAESDPSTLTVEFRDVRGVFARATPAGGGDGTTALATSPAGVTHVFAWDSAADGVALSAEDDLVEVRMAGTGTVLGTFAPSPVFRVDNRSHNQPPQLAVIRPAGVLAGDVTLAYVVTDPESDVCNVTLQLSLDGGVTYAAATGDPTAGVSSSPTGWLHTLTWRSATDRAGVSLATDVRLRMRASQSTPPLDSSWSQVTVAVDNGATLNSPPTLTFVDAGPSGVAPGLYDVWVLVRDAESDPVELNGLSYTFVSLQPGASPAADAPWLSPRLGATTSLGDLAAGAGLSSSPTGTLHKLTWDTAADLALPLPFAALVLRASVRDTYHASPVVLADPGLGPLPAPASVQLQNTTATGAGLALVSRGAGDVHAFWATPFSGSAGTLWHAGSRDFGTTFTSPNAVAAIQTRDPTAAAVPGGALLTAYSALVSASTQLRVTRSIDGGATWGSPAAVTTAQSDAEQPKLYVESATVVHLVWRDWAASNSQVYYARSTDGGVSFGAPVKVGPLEAEQYPYPAVAVAGGLVHVVWRGGSGVLKAAVSTDATGTAFATATTITTAGGFASYTQLLPTPDGVLHLALSSVGTTYARRAIGGTWTLTTLDADGTGAPSLFESPRGELVMGYAATPNHLGTLAQTRTITSRDGGLTWDAPVEVLTAAWQLTEMDPVTGQLSFITLQQVGPNLYPFYATLPAAPQPRFVAAGRAPVVTFDSLGGLRGFFFDATSVGQLASAGFPWRVEALPGGAVNAGGAVSLSAAAGRVLAPYAYSLSLAGYIPAMAAPGSGDDGATWTATLGPARLVAAAVGPDGTGYGITAPSTPATLSAQTWPASAPGWSAATALTALGTANTQPVVSHLLGKVRLLYVDASATPSVVRSSSSVDGAAWSSPVNVSKNAARHAASPVLLPRADGALLALWVEDTGSGWQARVAVSTTDGATFATPRDAGTELVPGGLLAATLDPAGVLVIGWGSTASLPSTAVSRDGGVTFGETTRHEASGVSSTPALASDVRGTYVVWSDPSSQVKLRTLRPGHVLSAGLAAPLVIPDGAGSASASFIAADGSTLRDVGVWLDVTHPSPADLTVTLTHAPPTGSPVTFTLVQAGVPFAPRLPVVFTSAGLAPKDSLAPLEGASLAGTWTLTVSDTVNGGVGQLNGWGLRFR